MDEQNQEARHTKKTLSFRANQAVAAVVILVVLLGGTFAWGLNLGKKGYVFESKEFKIVNQSGAPANVDYNLLWEAIDTVNQNYIDKPVSAEKFLYGAVKGAVAATGDPYTDFFTPDELNDFKTELKGSFDGIGAEVGKQGDNIVIIAPLDGTPAQKAGLKAKDIIVKVNGESTAGWSTDQAVAKIRGPKGTSVTLNIFREGKAKAFDVTITRAQIDVKSVKLEFRNVGLGNNVKKIAVITLSRFGDDTKALFDGAVNQVLTSGAKGLVLDLRNDPGGYLETAVDVASNWVPNKKVVVTEAHSDPSKSITYNSLGYGRLANLKTVVLINGGSASAAEILAGALHDYKIAELIGEKSFGKGSVQELIDLPGNSAVKVTVAKWITPNGKNLNKDGLDPDIAVAAASDNSDPTIDPQMDKALTEVTK